MKNLFLIILTLISIGVVGQNSPNLNLGTDTNGTVHCCGANAILQRYSSASGDRALFEQHSPNSQNRLVIQTLSGNSYISSLDNKPLLIQTGGGRVGIGTELPNWAFEVAGTGAGSGIMMSTGDEAFVGWYDRTLKSSSINNHWGWYASNGKTSLWDGLNQVNRLTVQNDGNVGIGTLDPQTRLDVRSLNVTVGEVRQVSTFVFGGWNHFENNNQTPTEGKFVFGSQAFSNGVIKRVELGFSTSGSWQTGGRLNFYTTPDDQSWVPVKRMTIDHSGNVGIGIANPSAKLEVDGTIISEEVKVQVVNGPDYVFEPDYTLPTLEETKAYIDTHKHLPEIPSAKEMEENGVALGEMNMILLKKIEELTLYILEQNENFKTQSMEIRQLKEELNTLKLAIQSNEK